MHFKKINCWAGDSSVIVRLCTGFECLGPSQHMWRQMEGGTGRTLGATSDTYSMYVLFWSHGAIKYASVTMTLREAAIFLQ